MVRFFGKTRKVTDARRTTAKRTKADAEPAQPDPAPDPKPERTPRRRVVARTQRPPRRDWAAEAASIPVGVPAPQPSSLATSEGDDDAAAVTKRRRGTRGGRGRKKTGPPVDPPAPAVNGASVPMSHPTEQAAQPAFDLFMREMTTTLRGLQATIADLQSRLSEPPSVPGTSRPRVGIFVDVPNLVYAAERRNIDIDFGRVLDYFTRDRELVRASAYAPISDEPNARLENQRFVHHFIGHPYRIITKPLKRFADGSMKANFDIELAIDILTMSDRLDVVVLMSGDGDFRRLVELIASRGVRVEVVAFGESAATELKTVADRYVDLGSHLDQFRAEK